MDTPIKLGVSSCLLGERVRYDGGHRLDRWIVDTLGKHVELVPVCPEAECGLGVPRERVHLAGDPKRPRLVTSRAHRDVTARMQAWARKRVRELEKENLCGFILKSNSPSCGTARVRLHNDKGEVVRNGVGVFARMFMHRYPLLPVEDEGRLHDNENRENFIERIFTCRRWRDLLQRGHTRRNLVDFHRRHKMLILSHSVKHAGLLGKLVARAKDIRPSQLFAKYGRTLMEALSVKATVKKHGNMLERMVRFFRKGLTPDEKQELLELVDEYRNGCVPLIVPITLINHYARKYDPPRLKEQVYLHPHPVELKLRNHA